MTPLAAADDGPGKRATDEQFPVASRLLPRATRGAVVRFYRFARAADDIADSPALPPDRKLALLHDVDAALRGAPAAAAHPAVAAAALLREDLTARRLSLEHARHLLQAFMQDAVKTRYDGWSDLLLYCNWSAAPVGRFLLDLHGEPRAVRPAADALCNAHQILNHLQDAAADRARLDRVYLPLRFFADAGIGVESLGDDRMSPALRRVFDRTLDGVEGLIAVAAALPASLRSRGLALQAAATLAMARRLSRKLRRRDALARRVALGRLEKLACVAGALLVRPERRR